MTKQALRESCEKNKLYRTARLNDKLYLHYKGWKKIENLDEYTGLKVLWLEGNGLLKIEGLEHQKELRTLYLHENVIEKIENLESQANLDTLNLAQNFIEKIENLSHMKELKTLLLPQNKLKELENLREIVNLPELSCLDIQKNKIEDPAILDLLEKCNKLSVLYLQGNPCVKHIRFYRKTMIARIKTLKYLDDRPVFPEERLRAEAWCRGLAEGGVEAARESEKAELDRQRKEKREKEEANFRAFEKMMLEGKRIREEREAAQRAAEQAAAGASAPVVPPTAPENASIETGVEVSLQEPLADAVAAPVAPPVVPSAAQVNPFSGEKIISLPENPESKAFREDQLRRAQERAAKTEVGNAASQDAVANSEAPTPEQEEEEEVKDNDKEDSTDCSRVATTATDQSKEDVILEKDNTIPKSSAAAAPCPPPLEEASAVQTVSSKMASQQCTDTSEDARDDSGAGFDELD